MKRIVLNRTSNSEIIDSRAGLQCRRSGGLLVGFMLAIIAGGPAIAGPTGAEVVGGEGTITYGGNLTRIDQATSRISINWDSFNVASNETVRFVQPSSASVALNTIFDQNPSQIFGAIDANGRVLLINPNGMIFGPSAQVNVAGLVASSLNISTADFMAGNYSFESAGGSGGLVLNQGALQAAPGGFIALIGEAVANEGLIVADAGTIAMGSGTKAALDFDGSGLLFFEVESEVLNNALGVDDSVRNSGSLFADGGQVLLTAAAAQDVFTNAINNEGLIRARRIDNTGGVVRLVGLGGPVIHSGDIDVSGGDQASTGGTAELLGAKVGIAQDASVIADGVSGGGTILVGGDVQGGGDVQSADFTYVGDGAVLSADALGHGNGGTVVVWAEEVARVYGDITARGGVAGGDGGLVETSGKSYLDFNGRVDASAANGEAGTWLLDPESIEITNANANITQGGVGDPGPITFDPAAVDTVTTIDVADINAALDGGSNVTISTASAGTTTPGDITVNAAILKSADGGNADGSTLTLDADNDILVNQSITATTGTLDVDLQADGSVVVAADIDANGGQIDISIDVDEAVTDGAESLDVQATLTGAIINLDGAGTNQNDTLIVSLTGGDAADWAVNGANSGTLDAGTSDTATFTNFSDLSGGAQVDTFALDVDFGGTVSGGAGDDQFNVNFDQSGTLNGGEGSDTFAIANGVVLTFAGTAIDGGADAAGDDTDTLDVSANVAALNVVLTGSTANEGFAGAEATVLTGAGGQFDGIDAIAASNNFGNTLTGLDVDSTWTYSSYSDGTETLNLSGEGTAIGGAGTNTLEGDDGGVDTADLFITDGLGFVTLVDQDFVNIDVLNGLNGDDTFNLTVADFGGTVSGGAGDDQFIVNVSQSGIVDGGAGTDEIVGVAGPNTFVVNAANAGTVNGTAFTNVENLTGGAAADAFTFTAALGGAATGAAGDDTFTLNDGGSAGTIDGGAGTDTQTYAGSTGPVTVSVASLSSIESLIGSGDAGDTLQGTAGADTFTTSGADAGTVNGAVNYSAFENLAGLGGNDVFNLLNAVTGTVDGGADTDEIVGVAGANTFVVNAANAGTVNGTAFTGVENLTGGAAADTFTFTAALGGAATGAAGDDTFTLNDGGSAGTIDGGAGTDTQTYAGSTGPVTVSVATLSSIETLIGSGNAGDTLQGTAGADTFTTSGADAGTVNGAVNYSAFENLAGLGGNDVFNLLNAVTGTVDGGADTDEIVGVAGANTFVVNAANAGTVNGTAFTGVENLTGGAAADTFTFTAVLAGAATGVAGDDTFTLNDGGSAGTIDGGAGTDTQTYAGSTGPVTVSVATLSSIETLIGSGNAGDTLQGTAGADTFTTSGADAGTVNGAVNYSAFENLAGLGGNDVFNLLNAVTGTVDGGADTDEIVGVAGANTFVVNAANAGTVNGTAFTGVENLTGGAAADTFTFTAALGGAATGAAGDDTFTLNDGGSAGTIDGGAGTDTASYAGRTTAVTVGIDTFVSIESLVGSAQSDTLEGTAGNDTFTVSAADAGNAGGVAFSSFENVAGLGGDDTFNMNAGVSGTVDGGAGTDGIVGAAGANTFVVNAANAGTVNGTAFTGVENLTGGAAADTFTFTAALTGTASGLAGDDNFNVGDNGDANLIDGGSGTDSLSYAARTSGVIVDMAVVNAVENFIGSNFDDTFNLNGDEGNDIDIDGSAGSDLFTVVSNSEITGDLDVANVDEVQIGADVTANNIALAVNGAITGTGMVFAQSLTTSSTGGQSIAGAVGTFDAANSGNGDIDLSNSGDLDVLGIVQSGGGDISVGTASELTQSGNITADGGSISMSAANGSLTMAQTAVTNSNGGDIDYETTGAGGDITLGLLQTCDDCQVSGSTGRVTVTAVGDILGQPRLGGQPHITAVTATLKSGGQIGSDPNSGGTPIVFENMALNGPEGEAPIMLEAPDDSFIISGNREVSSTGRVFDQSAGSRETAASAQAASQEEEEEVDWAAYSEDITVYEINNEGVQLPEEEEADDFVKIENEGVNIPIARNDTD